MSSDNKRDLEVSEELDQLENEHRQVPDKRRTIGRGPEVLREQLRLAAQRKTQLTMRLDADIIERFKVLSGATGSYQTLINRALHEWLEAQSVGLLLQPKLDELSELITRIEEQDKSLHNHGSAESGSKTAHDY